MRGVFDAVMLLLLLLLLLLLMWYPVLDHVAISRGDRACVGASVGIGVPVVLHG